MAIPKFDDSSISQEVLERNRAYDGRFLKVDSVRLRLANGNETVHEVIEHPGAVCLLVLDENDRVLLERQPRTALDRIIVEVPAGKLEPGEDPQECARRELIEETGYRVESMEHVLSFFTAAGYSDEVLHIFFAKGATAGEKQPEEDELIATFWLNAEEFVDCVLNGTIQDSKTVICGLWLAQKRLRDKLAASE